MRASKSILRAGVAALIGACGLALLHAQVPSSVPGADEYQDLSNPGREVVNFNIETVRGMVVLGGELYALNTHGSRLVHFDDLAVSTATASWKTLHNPVALAVWEGPEGDRLLVLGGATHALALQDPQNGNIEAVLNLPSEPGDIVVLNDHAYVSCMGANVVVDVDLSTIKNLTPSTREYQIPSQRPRFLHVADGRVFVAPFISGNNTTIKPITSSELTKLATVRQVPGAGLPDEDLFELVPGGPTPVVNAVLKGVGHLILDHARSDNGDYLLLSIEPDNDNVEQTEEGIKGRFAENTITRIVASQFPAPGGPALAVPTSSKYDLDDEDHSTAAKEYDEDHSCSFPFSIAIESLSGGAERVYVAGSTSDRILVLDGGFNQTGKIDLPPGSIPRDLLLTPLPSPGGTGLLVYEWGTNRIALFDTSAIDDDPGIDAPLREFELGIDPTPSSIQAGRSIWYDARRSEHGRTSCNTCHPGGSSDFLGWALSGDPADRKDVMVTQSLLSTEDTFPYHWRGERELRDFNREAFVGLLGADAPLDPTEFAQFQEFVFSLQAPRNPRQNPHRLLTGRAIVGQQVFHEDITAGPFSCSRCHALPTGSVGDMASDVISLIPSNVQFDTASLRQLYNKDGGSVSVDVDGLGTMQDFPLLGWGISHDGDEFDVFDFLAGFTFTGTGRADVTAFVDRFDQGIAPAAQMAWHLGANPDPVTVNAIQTYLLDQADEGWLDVCVFGTTSGQRIHWLYRPADGWFQADDASVTVGSALDPGFAWYSDLQSFGESNVFLGIPPMAGKVFALDHDNDGLDRGGELAALTDVENPDTDGDGFPDGYEVAHGTDPLVPTLLADMKAADPDPPQLLSGYPKLLRTSATAATYELAFDEPATYVLIADRSGADKVTRRRLDPVERDTIVVQGLKPSSMATTKGGYSFPRTPSAYSVSIRMADIAGTGLGPIGLSEQAVAEDHLEPYLEVGTFVNSLFADQPLTQIFSGLEVEIDPLPAGVLDMQVTATIEPLHEGIRDDGIGTPPAFFQDGKVLVAQLLKKDSTGAWTVVPVSQISDHSLPVTSSFVAQHYLLEGTPADLPGLDDILYTAPTETVQNGQNVQSGQATFAFQVGNATDPLSDGDELRLNMVGIFVKTTVQPDPAIPRFTMPSRQTWMMPLTQDDPLGDVSDSLRFVEVTYDEPGP